MEPAGNDVTSPPELGLWPSLSADDRVSRVVEASPTALVLAGQAGRIVMANRQVQQMFGHSQAELRGKPLELLWPARFRGQHDELWRGFLTNTSSLIVNEGRNMFGLRADGTEFPLEIGFNPIDFDDEPMVLVGLIDVTARHEIEMEMADQRRELERSNTDLEEFAYAASHDLKAPLRAISHLVQWIGEDVEPTASPETLENLRLLQGRTARLVLLLDGLLAYSRVGRTRTAAEKFDASDNVDIAEMVEEVVNMLAPPQGFVVTYEGTLVALRTNRMSLRVVMENLIGNALKHHDRPVGRITVSARHADGMVKFRVTDDGRGIEARFHERIFVIFQTLVSRDKVESSGIGLAIVKKKVQFHGGRIWIESNPPARGATFVFTWKETTL
jgi:PAS domain S-box-containing protein